MDFVSILDAREVDENEKLKRPAFYEDLNINQLIDVVSKRNQFYDIKDYFYYFPENEVCEEYRRDVYQDIKKKDLNKALELFCEKMFETRKKLSNKTKVNLQIQQKAWHVAAAKDYSEALIILQQALEKEEKLSLGMGKLLLYIKSKTEQSSFQKMKEKALEINNTIKEMNFIVTIENERINVVSAKENKNYEEFLGEFSEGSVQQLKNPFGEGLSASMLEKAMLEVLEKTTPDFFEKLSKFNDEFSDFLDKIIVRLEKELQFYMTFYNFQQEMQENGCKFTKVKKSENGKFVAKEVSDIMLAYTNGLFKRPTVSNNVDYEKEERFLIVSGPNQGGKTTYARSLGQMIFLKKLGLDVPAGEAELPYFKHILTHFSVEESMETGCGKLKEELLRLSPMMQKEVEDAYIVINELFTTAANYDAFIMGERVLKHFINKGCYGVYVTHIKELAKDNEKVVSMIALLDENDYHKRTYKIVKKYSETSGHAGDIAEKYNLSYSQLKERLHKNNSQTVSLHNDEGGASNE